MATKILGRDDFLSGNHLKRELVEVPGMDGSVYLRELSTAQMLSFNARVNQLRQSGSQEITPEISVELMSLLVSFSACDEDGRLLFSEEDARQLTDNKLEALTYLAKKVLDISGINLNIDEVIADLKKAPSDSSSSASHRSSTKARKRS